MTVLAVLSDIHGNLPALQAVMADMQRYTIDHVVIAGDHTGGGPFPRQVMETIFAHNWATVRGNNEFYLLDYETPRAPQHWSRYTIPPITNELLGEQWLQVIACMPDHLSLRFRDAPPIYVCHGRPGNPWQTIYPQTPINTINEWLEPVAESTVILGHSHVAMERHVNGWHIFNPGSVGVPLDGQLTASYMVLQGNDTGWSLLEHRRITFDSTSIFTEFERQQFVEQAGVAARLVVEEFHTARLQVHPFYTWLNCIYPDESESRKRLQEFLAIDDKSDYTPSEYRELDGTFYRD